jgi:hypothetical protein
MQRTRHCDLLQKERRNEGKQGENGMEEKEESARREGRKKHMKEGRRRRKE